MTNPDFVSFVAELAEDFGWSVMTCRNELELLEQLGEAGTPALVFRDVLMPEMDGIEAVKNLAELGRCTHSIRNWWGDVQCCGG